MKGEEIKEKQLELYNNLKDTNTLREVQEYINNICLLYTSRCV